MHEAVPEEAGRNTFVPCTGSTISLNDKIHCSHTPGLRHVSRDPSRCQFPIVDEMAVEMYGIENDKQLVGKVDFSNPNRRKSGFCVST